MAQMYMKPGWGVDQSREGSVRTQLSLYITGEIAAALEQIRRRVDPVQSRLIPAHITLCREDELDGISTADLASRLKDARAIELRFGPPERFLEHGILLPCIEGEESFAALRRRVLGTREPRRLPPHITLAHPRNPRAEGNSLEQISLPRTIAVVLGEVRLIEQAGSEPWQVLAGFALQS